MELGGGWSGESEVFIALLTFRKTLSADFSKREQAVVHGDVLTIGS